MLNFLENVTHKITVGSMEFRKSVSELLDKANRGYAVVITVNNKPKAVIVAPSVADAFFADHEQVLTPGDQNDDLSTQEAEDNLPDCPACVPQNGLMTDVHETLTKQHPTGADIPQEAQMVNKAGVPSSEAPIMETPVQVLQPGESSAPAASAVETPAEVSSSDESTTEAPVASVDTQDTPVEPEVDGDSQPDDEPADDILSNGNDGFPCQASLAVPNVDCVEPSVKRVVWRGISFNVCQKHLDQLNAKNQLYTDLGDPS